MRKQKHTPITINDLETFILYVKAHETDFDTFNVAIVESVFVAFAAYLRAGQQL